MTTAHCKAPELTSGDPERDYFARMETIRQQDSARIISVDLETRTPSAAVHECGLVASETFVFALRVASLTEQTLRLSIRVTADLALALAEEHPESADMLVAAWSELTTVADQLNEEACRGGLEADRGRRAKAATQDAP